MSLNMEDGMTHQEMIEKLRKISSRDDLSGEIQKTLEEAADHIEELKSVLNDEGVWTSKEELVEDKELSEPENTSVVEAMISAAENFFPDEAELGVMGGITGFGAVYKGAAIKFVLMKNTTRVWQEPSCVVDAYLMDDPGNSRGHAKKKDPRAAYIDALEQAEGEEPFDELLEYVKETPTNQLDGGRPSSKPPWC